MKKLSLMKILKESSDFDEDADEYERKEVGNAKGVRDFVGGDPFAHIEKKQMEDRVRKLKQSVRDNPPKRETPEERLEKTKELYFRVGGFYGKYAPQLLRAIRKFEPDFEMDKESEDGFDF
jgi:hypothetical protein